MSILALNTKIEFYFDTDLFDEIGRDSNCIDIELLKIYIEIKIILNLLKN